MPTPFADAARRHLRDGDLLRNEGRLANADHLFGFASECALKAALHGLGVVRLRAGGRQMHRVHQAHADEFWPLAVALLADRVAGRWLPLLGEGNPFQDWRASQRYADDAAGPTPEVVDTHRGAALRAMWVLDEALLDGVIR